MLRRRGIHAMRLLFGLFVLLLLAKGAVAADWYVDKDARGKNKGTSWKHAWESFADIRWSRVDPGDTVYISGGSKSKTYKSTLTISDSGRKGKPITVTVGKDSGHRGRVIISGNSNGIVVNGDWVTVSGYKRARAGDWSDHINWKIQRATGAAGVLLPKTKGDGHTGVIIEYLEVTKCRGKGIGFEKINGGRNEIRYCNVHRNVRSGKETSEIGGMSNYAPVGYDKMQIHHCRVHHIGGDGIGAKNNCSIHHCTVSKYRPTSSGIHGDGIMMSGGQYIKIHHNEVYATDHDSRTNSAMRIAPIHTRYFRHVRIYNNLCRETLSNSGIDRGIEISTKDGPCITMRHVLVANNTIADFSQPGLILSMTHANSTKAEVAIVNNILINNGGAQFQIVALDGGTSFGNYGDDANIQFDNNIIYDGKGPMIEENDTWYDYSSWVRSRGCNKDGRSSKPSFVRYRFQDPRNNFHLRAKDRVARDKGQNLFSEYGIRTDFDDERRPRRGAWDIGAYEF